MAYIQPLPPKFLQIMGGLSGRLKNRRYEFPSIVCSVKSITTPKMVINEIEDVHNKKIGKAAERGVKKATRYLLKEVLKVTPIDTGNLRESGQTAFIGEGFKTKGVVYFDEIIAPYAIYVHEDLTKYHEPPTMAKFLQRTQWKERANISRIIAEECAKGA